MEQDDRKRDTPHCSVLQGSHVRPLWVKAHFFFRQVDLKRGKYNPATLLIIVLRRILTSCLFPGNNRLLLHCMSIRFEWLWHVCVASIINETHTSARLPLIHTFFIIPESACAGVHVGLWSHAHQSARLFHLDLRRPFHLKASYENYKRCSRIKAESN